MGKFLLKHGHLIVDGNREFIDGAILINEEKIEDVFPQSDLINVDLSEYRIVDLKGAIVMPGFFDTHTHGLNGIDFDHASKEEYERASKEYAKTGTTSYFYTLIPAENIYDNLHLLNTVEDKYARFQGIHLEGPFLSKKNPGAIDPNYFIEPNIRVVDSFIKANNKIKSMTVAYELNNAKETCEHLRMRNVRVMLGHTTVLQDELDKDNYDGYTHLYNAMRPFHHRDKSLVNDAFVSGKYAELICDGYHVDKDVLRVTLNEIDKERVMIISDSTLAKGLPDGRFEFAGQMCTKNGIKFMNDSGHISGSVACINDEMKVLRSIGVSYTDLLRYSGLNAYRLYGLDHLYGTIQKGKMADLCVMDDDLNVKATFVRGNVISNV